MSSHSYENNLSRSESKKKKDTKESKRKSDGPTRSDATSISVVNMSQEDQNRIARAVTSSSVKVKPASLGDKSTKEDESVPVDQPNPKNPSNESILSKQSMDRLLVTKKMATGGVNTFDMNLAKETQAKTVSQAESESTRCVRSKSGRGGSGLGGRRTHRQTDQTEAQHLLVAGPGLLERAQRAKRTRFGRMVQRATITQLTTLAEQHTIRSNPRASTNLKILLNEPFNQLSAVSDTLGLTGAGGIVKERFQQFPRPIAYVLNVSYELPLLKLPGIVTDRIPVEDDRKEDLEVYFDEVVERMYHFHSQGLATVVHCMAGVSRSATFVIAFLMRHESMSLEEAFRRTKAARPPMNPNLGFLEQLSRYEGKCRPADQCSPWCEHTLNQVTKHMPEFIITHYLDDYLIEFEPNDDTVDS